MKRKALKRKKAVAVRKPPVWSPVGGLGHAALSLGAYGALCYLGHGLGLPEGTACFLAGAGVALGLCPAIRILASGPSVALHSQGLKDFRARAREATDVPTLANVVVAALQDVFAPQHLYLWLPPAGDASFHLVAGVGRQPTTLVIPEFSLRQLLKERPKGPWSVSSARRASSFDQLLDGLEAHVCVPLSLHGQLLGLVTFGAPKRRQAFSEKDLELLACYGQAIAEAIAPHQLRAEQALHLSKLETVSRLYMDAQKKAVTDGLTGLTTHMHFQEQLAKRFFEARRFAQPLSLMFIDVDHFKKINDTYGHLTGDEVLRVIAQTVQESARACDLVARYGGEELSMLLPQTDLEGATILAERLREAIHGLRVQEAQGSRLVRVTASIGVAQLDEDDLTPAELLDRADRAVYEAKHQGRNRVIQSA